MRKFPRSAACGTSEARNTNSPVSDFDQIDQAGIASGDLRRQPHNFPEHLIQRQFGADNPAHAVQDRRVGTLRFHYLSGHHTSERKPSIGCRSNQNFLSGGFSATIDIQS